MSTARATATRPGTAAALGEGAVSVVLGAGFTLGLFLLMARLDHTTPATPPADILDLRMVSVAEPPPPPREVPPREQAPLPDSLVGIESTPSESPVRIAVTPPDLESLLPPPQLAPPAVIRVGQLYPNLKPKMDVEIAANHIYQMAEVDRIPQVLNRVTPSIPTNVRKGAATLRTSFVFVVDVNGEIKNVRIAVPSGNPEFDAIVEQSLHEWTFSPAVRRGQKVRCLLQQAIIIRWSGGSPFEL